MLKSILGAVATYREMKDSKASLQQIEKNYDRMIEDSNVSLAAAQKNLETARKENEEIRKKAREGEEARKARKEAFDEKRRELEDPNLTFEQRLVLIKQLGEFTKNTGS
jgi:hypothetical protein